jgi:hypothetical protein
VNEDALRALVRDTIARLDNNVPRDGSPTAPNPTALINLSHPSHYQYNLPPSDGPCFIEPGVRCNHCGYCQSHGH